MNILVTLNSNYIRPLKVMLWSLFFNNPGQAFQIYLVHSTITKEELDDLKHYVDAQGHEISFITIGENYFSDAPLTMHYSKEMYYRLLAYQVLPRSLEKILYLDPDILIINPIDELYHMEIENYLYGAAYHVKSPVREINKLRLNAYGMEEYFNSGVLLMNLSLQREKIDEREIFAYVDKHKSRLLMPDQDILNALYSKEIKKLDEIKYNFDTRYYQYHKILSNGTIDMDYMMDHTVVLHFCGKKKPWHKQYSGRFQSLYKHYETLALRSDRQPSLHH